MEKSDESKDLKEIYREIEGDLDVNQAKYAKPAQDDDAAGLEHIVLRLESVFPSLKKSNDASLAVTDASLTRRITSIGSIRTLASFSNRDEDKLKKYMSVLVNWKANGENVWKRIVESPGIGRLGHGSEILAVAELIKSRKKDDDRKEEKVKQKRAIHSNDVSESKPEKSVMFNNFQNSQKTSHKSESGAEELYQKLSSSFSDKSIPIKNLDLVDNDSFSKTIENFFNFSFLVSEQCVDLGQNEDRDVTCKIKQYDPDTDADEAPQGFVHGAIVLKGKDWKK